MTTDLESDLRNYFTEVADRTTVRQTIYARGDAPWRTGVSTSPRRAGWLRPALVVATLCVAAGGVIGGWSITSYEDRLLVFGQPAIPEVLPETVPGTLAVSTIVPPQTGESVAAPSFTIEPDDVTTSVDEIIVSFVSPGATVAMDVTVSDDSDQVWTLTSALVDGPAGAGTVAISGPQLLTFTASDTFGGSAWGFYEMTDGTETRTGLWGLGAPELVDRPSEPGDLVMFSAGEPHTVNLFAIKPDLLERAWTVVLDGPDAPTVTEGGTVLFSSGGDVTVTPDPGFSGKIQVRYTVTEPGGLLVHERLEMIVDRPAE